MYMDDNTRLRHMLEAAREALSFAEGHDRVDLDRDRQLVMALIKEVEILGEAANQVSLTTRSEHPGIPWEDIIGMRHRLVHAYFAINLDILWATMRDDLPPLLKQLERIL